MGQKGVRWHHGEFDILKEGPGAKNIMGGDENQTPSIKVLFKTNINSHKHPSIRLLDTNERGLS